MNVFTHKASEKKERKRSELLQQHIEHLHNVHFVALQNRLNFRVRKSVELVSDEQREKYNIYSVINKRETQLN